MPLSEEEQRLLDEMERNLYGEHTDVHSSSAQLGRVSSRGVVLGIVGIVLGIAGLIAGLSTGFFVWGLLGFALMLGGCIAAFSMRQSPSPRASRPNSAPSSSSRTGRTFMERLEDRWDDQAR